ncbi:GntR family transcriptional regulator [Bordetella genomosp. 10]|uniref:GntR family transcriptional regulator n=1 Tax=Bordetella genomosp. 10 TaxID=1416804 RepID=A0A261S646_9BORD|nr:GntR family transcriptional regulator [Bordetella genomosp. 10]OZI32260.1 GntR family transcriptional regulator [Bordetella genomosp. 10]
MKNETTATSDMNGEDIAADIARAIISQRLPPGTRLREEALARAYGVSRTKIRAALLMLTKDKLITTVPDKGAFVSKPTAEEARDIFAVRRILEVAMVREFVARATPADYRRIERHLKDERKIAAREDVRLRNLLLADFHLLLAEVAGNTVLTEMLRELSARSSVITAFYQSTMDAVCSSDEHREFLRVAREGDVERACALMVEHLEHVEQALDFEDAPRPRGGLVAALLT